MDTKSAVNTWRGVVIEESLNEKSLLKKVRIIATKISKLEKENRIMTFHKIEIPDAEKQEYIENVKKLIKNSFYMHLCKGGEMIVVFKDKVFTFKKSDPELLKAREYGKSVGIIAEQMPFEHLVDNPFD